MLTSGPLPPNPGEIVAARRFTATIERLQREADLVIVDSPAMLPVGDASAIASSVDGLVFLVDMHLVKRPQLGQAADQLRRLPCRLLGTVVRGDEHARRPLRLLRCGVQVRLRREQREDEEEERRPPHRRPSRVDARRTLRQECASSRRISTGSPAHPEEDTA